MRRALSILALAGVIASGNARADLANFVKICGDPKASAYDIILFCQKAIDTGDLSDSAESQVRANMGVGFFDLQQYGDAVAEYTRALQKSPRMVAAYINRARALERLNRLQEAASDYASALQVDPGAADAHLGRGALLLSHGDPGRAISDFTQAIALEPDWIAPFFNRGVAHYQLGLWQKADGDFSMVIQRNPNDAAAFLNRGRARAAENRSDAGADFDRALAIDPEWGGGWFARGQYWDARGNREAANRDFLRAYELGYPDPWLIKRVQEISG